MVELHNENRFEFPFVILTGFGAGESGKYVNGIIAKIVFKTLRKDVYANKTRMEEIFAESDLKWVIVRPGVLLNDSLTEKYRVELKLYKGLKIGSISRADMADNMVKQSENLTEIGNYVALSSK